jgi:signal transduction histidine kinase
MVISRVYFDDEEVWLVCGYDISMQISTESDRREMLKSLVTAQEDERRVISREIHDHVGQALTALTLGLQAMHSNLDRPETLQHIGQLEKMVTDLGHEMHEVAFNLRPSSLDDLGLIATLNNYAVEWNQKHNIPIDFQVANQTGFPIPADVSNAVYRAVMEGLSNVARHSSAKRCSLVLDQRLDWLLVILEDDGVGFDYEQVKALPYSQRLGIVGMIERIELVDGNLQIESNPGKGTTIYIRTPLSV